MMKCNEAMNIFSKKHPNLTITRCIDYDEDHYVLEAVKNLNAENYGDTFFGVDKNSGEITGFLPALEIDYFFEALESRTVYSL